MEAILSVAVLAGLGYGALKAVTFAREALHSHSAAGEERRHLQQRALAERQQRQATHARLNGLARTMQIALLQLQDAPDFRRATSYARAARDVPVAFRRRQYFRFRPQLVEHFRRCLDGGVDRELLAGSLRELVEALGHAAFEADYIAREAEQAGRARSTQAPPDFATQLQQAQRDHEQRLAALRTLQGLPPELLERLVEAEETRFANSLLGRHHGQDQ